LSMTTPLVLLEITLKPLVTTAPADTITIPLKVFLLIMASPFKLTGADVLDKWLSMFTPSPPFEIAVRPLATIVPLDMIDRPLVVLKSKVLIPFKVTGDELVETMLSMLTPPFKFERAVRPFVSTVPWEEMSSPSTPLLLNEFKPIKVTLPGMERPAPRFAPSPDKLSLAVSPLIVMFPNVAISRLSNLLLLSKL